jgi:hypothetical protein
MRYLISLMLLAAVFCTFSCSKKSTNGEPPPPPPPPEPFSFRVTVTDVGGDSLEGIRISGWNHLSIPFPASASGQDDPADMAAGRPSYTTTFAFSANTACNADLSVYDLAGDPVITLVDEYLSGSGTRVRTWHEPSGGLATGVYKCVLNCTDSLTGSLMFADSIYAVLYRPDADISVFGFTGSDGVFETGDSLLFPNTFELPSLVNTDQGGNPQGTFSIFDTVTIVLTDTATGKQQEFQRTVTSGKNEFELTWDPAAAMLPKVMNGWADHQRSPAVVRKTASMASEWKLWQNYPNPFD